MATLTSASFVVLFACSWIFIVCQGTQEVNVKPGDNATLQCRSHRNGTIDVIKWNRTDLKSDDCFVFYLSPDKINGEYQNSLFQGRVVLQDQEMKNGNASVILKNVTINDTGTYECWIRVNNSRRSKRDAAEPISTVKLSVTGLTGGHKEGGDKEGGDKERGDKERNVGLKVDLSVVLLLAVAVGRFIF